MKTANSTMLTLAGSKSDAGRRAVDATARSQCQTLEKVRANQMERIKEMLRDWYSSLDDLVDDLKDAGFSPEDVNREYVTAWDEKSEDDVYFIIRLGGTERTITVDDIAWEVV